jgi:V/A-type H+-transporting ATPase subunit B
VADPLLYTHLDRIEGPLVAVVTPSERVGLGDAIEVRDRQGRARRGRVMLLEGERVVIEVFQGTEGLAKEGCSVRFRGEPIQLALSPEIIGRRFNGVGEPIDGGPPIDPELRRDVNGSAINPVARDYPEDFIQTGVSGIDGMNALVRGQKLPLFSASGLPHDELAIQIARQAKVRPLLSQRERKLNQNFHGKEAVREALIVVFCAIGVKHDVAMRFAEEIRGETVAFLNLADDPPMERLLTPRMALTAAEYLAFDLGHHVLVILTDMTNYGEALREIATARGDVPSRKGYPGYLYSDLASIFERAGRIKGRPGSITQLPILTMPNNDITHPIPDLTGYITEGQIVLSQELHQRGVYPPIELLPSLSRLMKDGVGAGHTRADHFPLMGQLYAAYARSQEVRLMSRIIGEADLSEADRAYLRFGDILEQRFLRQAPDEDRTIEQTLDLGWRCLGCLPENELRRLTRGEIEDHRRLLDQGQEWLHGLRT